MDADSRVFGGNADRALAYCVRSYMRIET